MEVDRRTEFVTEAAQMAPIRVRPIDRTRPGSLLGRVLRNKGEKCYLQYPNCRILADSVEHVIPKSRWRRDDAGNFVVDPDVMWNLKPACKACNVKKGDKMPEGVKFQFGSTSWKLYRKGVCRDCNAGVSNGKCPKCKSTNVDRVAWACAKFLGWYCDHDTCLKGLDGRTAGNVWGTIRAEQTQEPVHFLEKAFA